MPALVVWIAGVSRGEFIPLSWKGALWLSPYAATIFAGQRPRQHVAQRRTWRRAHLVFVGVARLALLKSLSWFRDPMHDIALAFGSRGRWGCGVVDDDGSPYYTLDDHTVPRLLFEPVLVLRLAGWVALTLGIAFVSAAISAIVVWLSTLLLRLAV